jgi:hypothetical protein
LAIGAKIKRFISDYCTWLFGPVVSFSTTGQALQEFNKSKNNKLSVIVKKQRFHSSHIM